MHYATLVVWGFLLGFVGWTSCFLLPDPIEKRLLGIKDKAANLRAFARLLIMLFLVFGMLLVLVLPALTFVAAGAFDANSTVWRSMMGTAFFASLGGFFVNGLMRRFGGSEKSSQEDQ